MGEKVKVNGISRLDRMRTYEEPITAVAKKPTNFLRLVVMVNSKGAVLGWALAHGTNPALPFQESYVVTRSNAKLILEPMPSSRSTFGLLNIRLLSAPRPTWFPLSK